MKKSTAAKLIGSLVVGIVLVLFIVPGVITNSFSAGHVEQQIASPPSQPDGIPPATSLPNNQAPPGDVNWGYYGNDYANTRFTNLTQINPGNAGNLTVAWSFNVNSTALNIDSSMEVSPIEINGTIYITTGQDVVYALNATSGALKWSYNPGKYMPPLDSISLCCGEDNRGVAIGDGLVFLTRLDGVVQALNTSTGVPVWNATVADWHHQYSITMAPQFVNNEVLVGVSGGDELATGFLKALNAHNGHVLWTFNSTVPATYNYSPYILGGGAIWGNPTVDQSLGLAYIVIGNPGSDLNGEYRNGTNLYSDSVVALNITTGKEVWYFQSTHHDLWDFDWSQPVALFNVKGQPALGGCSKSGIYWILNRQTGKPLYPYQNVSVPSGSSWQNAWSTQPISGIHALTPVGIQNNTVFSPSNMSYAPMFTPENETDMIYQPSTFTGCEWDPQSYSPLTHDVYYPGRYLPQYSVAYQGQTEGAPPANETGWGSGTHGLTNIMSYGIFGATNTTTGKVDWSHNFPGTMLSGSVVAGSVVFVGDDGGNFYAFNAANGAPLWSFSSSVADSVGTILNGGGANGAPIAYMVNGHEYIAMAFGGSGAERSNGIGDPQGDAFVVFALSSVVGHP